MLTIITDIGVQRAIFTASFCDLFNCGYGSNGISWRSGTAWPSIYRQNSLEIWDFLSRCSSGFRVSCLPLFSNAIPREVSAFSALKEYWNYIVTTINARGGRVSTPNGRKTIPQVDFWRNPPSPQMGKRSSLPKVDDFTLPPPQKFFPHMYGHDHTCAGKNSGGRG